MQFKKLECHINVVKIHLETLSLPPLPLSSFIYDFKIHFGEKFPAIFFLFSALFFLSFATFQGHELERKKEGKKVLLNN